MSHPQQVEFCKKVKNIFPEFFCYKLVLDVGSLDINGNNRYLFENCTYLGIDVAAGNNVDLVANGSKIQLPDESIDVIISTECLEHDMFYSETLVNIYRMLKPGGLFLFTCATEGRPEHGTSRTTPQDAPLIQDNSEWKDYYKNLSESDIRKVLDIEQIFKQAAFEVNHVSHDLYFYGFKNGELPDNKNIYYSKNKLEEIIEENYKTLIEKDAVIVEKDLALFQKNAALVEKETALAELNLILSETKVKIEALLNSRSWRYSKFLRVLGMAARNLKRLIYVGT